MVHFGVACLGLGALARAALSSVKTGYNGLKSLLGMQNGESRANWKLRTWTYNDLSVEVAGLLVKPPIGRNGDSRC